MSSLFLLSSLSALLLVAGYYFAYRTHGTRFFLFLALGWAAQLLYVGFVGLTPEPLVPFPVNIELRDLSSVLSAFFFALAVEHLRQGHVRRRFLVLLSVAVLPLALVNSFIGLPTIPIVSEAVRGISFLLIASALIIATNETLLSFVTPDQTANWLRGLSWVSSVGSTGGALTLIRRLQRLALFTRITLAGSLLGYGLLVLAYPILQRFLPVYESSVFVLGRVLMLAHAVGLYTLLLAGYLSLGEAARSMGAAEDLAAVAASIEHDLRAPLANLWRDVSSLTLEFPDNDKLTRRSMSLETNLRRIRAALELITVLREDRQHTDSSAARVDLAVLVDDSVSLLRANLAVPMPIVQKRPSAGVNVVVVRSQIVQALRNILMNAVEAFAETEKTADAVIIIRCERRGRAGVISVRDNGPGVPPELLPLIFRPPFTTKQGENRGLGLFIAARLVEINKGTIAAESDGETFAEFSVHLPIARG